MAGRFWCCPDCETLSPMSQPTCGACGAEQSADVGNLEPEDLYNLTMSAEYTRPGVTTRSRGKAKRRKR